MLLGHPVSQHQQIIKLVLVPCLELCHEVLPLDKVFIAGISLMCLFVCDLLLLLNLVHFLTCNSRSFWLLSSIPKTQHFLLYCCWPAFFIVLASLYLNLESGEISVY